MSVLLSEARCHAPLPFNIIDTRNVKMITASNKGFLLKSSSDQPRRVIMFYSMVSHIVSSRLPSHHAQRNQDGTHLRPAQEEGLPPLNTEMYVLSENDSEIKWALHRTAAAGNIPPYGRTAAAALLQARVYRTPENIQI
ncbi:hypothetical protein Bbelb_208140 [Branchiostoma belcheri]|nr:hypothetical protein Bbelb_208140 [Branchiostoma belcheri]